MIVCGIDEAGRGPLIGPLVIAGVSLDQASKEELQRLGVTDSKMLSPSRRFQLAKEIKTKAQAFHIVVVPPEEIDAAVDSSTTNLNYLEAEKSAEIINVLKPDKAILDCPSTNPADYEQFVRSRLQQTTLPLVTEHKADLHHTEVAAGSILAKVTRDVAIEGLKKQIGIDFGSGYPADPRTVRFVRSHVDEYPALFRKSWKTYKQATAHHKQKTLS